MDHLDKPLDLPAEWLNVDVNSVRESVARKYQKHGLFAQMPLICKGNECPYSQACYEFATNTAVVGSRCIPEMSSVITYTTQYCSTLNVDFDNFIDMTLIKDLVNVDLIIDRCNKILTIENMVVDVNVTAIGKTVIKKPEVHKAHEILERMIARKERLLQLLNATRRDKARTGVEAPVDIAMIISQTRSDMDHPMFPKSKVDIPTKGDVI